ncbi:uncharacterized protein HBSAL_09070 [Halobacterium salinarum]|uniref:Uncharacterized protein n=2 Tax=Halobacterium salinarum TaxID=2242 RepID=A0A510N7L0_HALSA|nr:uncharacterized protein HBSAL_09070 [Halobacterium salinarum]DAC78718.1 TPA_inf: uncharacterized protein VNG_1762a [Halobacterium salinarum NRC-1]
MNYGIVIGFSVVAPTVVILLRSKRGITPSEYQILGWLAIIAVTQFQTFISLPFFVRTIFVSVGLGMAVVLVYDLVFLFRSVS